jgi:hypothetical protein
MATFGIRLPNRERPKAELAEAEQKPDGWRPVLSALRDSAREPAAGIRLRRMQEFATWGSRQQCPRTAQDLLDLSFEQSFFLMVVCDHLENLRVLQLSSEHIVLIALAYAVASAASNAEMLVPSVPIVGAKWNPFETWVAPDFDSCRKRNK